MAIPFPEMEKFGFEGKRAGFCLERITFGIPVSFPVIMLSM